MIALTKDAQELFDRYVQEIRSMLRGCRTVDPDDVERDVREHIDRELHDASEPVNRDELDSVLRRLGNPSQWVPEDELPQWRRVLRKLRTGPEDYRLAYLSFGLLVLSLLLGGPFSGEKRVPFRIALLLFFMYPYIFLSGPASVIFLASFCLSRATLSTTSDPHKMGGTKWLIYPSLVLFYFPLVVFLFLWPIPMVLTSVDPLGLERLTPGPLHVHFGLLIGCISVGVCGLWWLVLGLALKKWPELFRIIFRPFADGLDLRKANRLSLVGLALALSMTVGIVAGYLAMANE